MGMKAVKMQSIEVENKSEAMAGTIQCMSTGEAIAVSVCLSAS